MRKNEKARTSVHGLAEGRGFAKLCVEELLKEPTTPLGVHHDLGRHTSIELHTLSHTHHAHTPQPTHMRRSEQANVSQLPNKADVC